MTKATLTFNNLLPPGAYYGFAENYDGYQGFNFSDMIVLSSAAIQHYGYEDTGYSVDLHGNGEMFTMDGPFYEPYGWGVFSSPTSETFTWKSGDFASAWCSQQAVTFTTYRGSEAYAQIIVDLGQYENHIDFAKWHNAFKDITSVSVFSAPGSYGRQGLKGYQIVIDNLKVQWNGGIPHASGARHHAHVVLGVLGAMQHHAAPFSGSCPHSAMPDSPHGGFHSEITSLDAQLGHHSGGLTSEFSLPAPEHFFGT